MPEDSQDEPSKAESVNRDASEGKGSNVFVPIALSVIAFGIILFAVSIGLSSESETGSSSDASDSNQIEGSENDFSDLTFPEKGANGEIVEDRDDWVPFGYEALTSSVAYEKIPASEMSCGYSSAHSCYQAYFTSKFACQVFVDVSFLVDGVKVDTGIDSGFLDPRTGSLLSFVSFESARYTGDKSVKIEQVNCY